LYRLTWASSATENGVVNMRKGAGWLLGMSIGVSVIGCETVPPGEAAASKTCGVRYVEILDRDFLELEGGDWRYTQHAGERSFTLSSSQGELEITRISGQPWMIFRQSIPIDVKTGQTLIYSAELKGDIAVEPALHAFEHVAGLLLQPGAASSSAVLAEHVPNQGVWDWQPVSIQRKALMDSESVAVGFVHQAGGTLWARNPKLAIMDCQ